jgi:hypothetical protein
MESPASKRRLALAGTLFFELNQAFAIELWKPQPPKPSLKEGKARSLGAPHALVDLLKVSEMKPDEIAERPGFAASDRRIAPVDAPLGLKGPFLRVPPAKNVLLTYFPFRLT